MSSLSNALASTILLSQGVPIFFLDLPDALKLKELGKEFKKLIEGDECSRYVKAKITSLIGKKLGPLAFLILFL